MFVMLKKRRTASLLKYTYYTRKNYYVFNKKLVMELLKRFIVHIIKQVNE